MSGGGINADLTITRLGDDQFLIVVAELFHRRVEAMLRRAIGHDHHVFVTDMTSAYTMLSVQGPNSRALLQNITTASLDNDAFPYFTAQQIDLVHGRAWALRMSFVGELGWELYIPTEFATHIYERIVEVGADHGLRHAGIEDARVDSHRSRASSTTGSTSRTPTLPLKRVSGGRSTSTSRAALSAATRSSRSTRGGRTTARLVQFLLDDAEPLLYGEEPILRDGETVGYLRSGAYGHTLGGAVGFGYVENSDGVTKDFIESGTWTIPRCQR